MNSLEWKEDLDRLLARLLAAGMTVDVGDLDLSEQRAVYRVLCRLLRVRSGNE